LASLAPEDGAPSDQPSGFTAGSSAVGLARAALGAGATSSWCRSRDSRASTRSKWPWRSCDRQRPGRRDYPGDPGSLAFHITEGLRGRRPRGRWCVVGSAVVGVSAGAGPYAAGARRLPERWSSSEEPPSGSATCCRWRICRSAVGASQLYEERGWWQPRNRAARRAGRWRCR